ncbi:hypothetical protein ACFLR7_01775 [Acidobacteriota bacterium]
MAFHPIPNPPGWNRPAGCDNARQEAGFYSSLPLQCAGRLLPQNPANMGDQTEYIDKKSLFA